MTDPDHPAEAAQPGAGAEPAEAAAQRAPVPGERRLARPPSERYRDAEASAAAGAAGAAAAPRAVSPVRGLGLGAVVALAGAAVMVILGGVLATTIGLVVLAGIVGWLTAVAVGFGTGATLPPSRRAWTAAGVAVLGVLLGQVGLWLYAASEGGVLALPDYLGEVYGPLVPLELVVAGVVAWVTAR